MRHPSNLQSIAIVSLVAACVVGGCASKAASVASENITGVASSAARIDVRADTIISAAKSIEAGVPRVTIVEQAGGIKADGHDLTASLAQEQENVRLMAGTINADAVTHALDQQELKRFWSRTQRHWGTLIICGAIGTWFAFGMLSVYAPLLWGLKGLTISKSIIRFLPLANLFSNARDHKLAQAGL